MTVATAYQNDLDQWYSSCHPLIQRIFHGPYTQVSEWLHWVTGDPQKLADQGPVYVDISREIEQIAVEVGQASSAIRVWRGQARDAFNAKMQALQSAIHDFAPSVAKTKEILEAAAQTSVDCANMILDVIKALIEWLIQRCAVAIGAAVLTFGASVVEFLAEGAIRIALKVAKIVKGMTKLARFLRILAKKLRQIVRLMKKVKKIIKKLRKLMKKFDKQWKKMTKPIRKELEQEAKDLFGKKLGKYAGNKAWEQIEKRTKGKIDEQLEKPFTVTTEKTVDGVNKILGTNFSTDGPKESLKEAWQDTKSAFKHSNEAVDVARRERRDYFDGLR